MKKSASNRRENRTIHSSKALFLEVIDSIIVIGKLKYIQYKKRLCLFIFSFDLFLYYSNAPLKVTLQVTD